MNRSLPHGRVLVLGGTGFLGSEIARAFMEQGSSVTVVARHPPEGVRADWLRSADVVLGTAGDDRLVARALVNVDHVVHALGCPYPADSNSDPVGDLSHTVPTLIRLLEALRERPGVSLSFLSSGGTVYGNPVHVPIAEDGACDPITAYGVTKMAAEKYIGMYSELYGIPVRVLRVSNAYGSLQSAARGQGLIAAFLEAAQSRTQVRIFGDGSAVRDYVSVEDIAQAAVQLAGNPGGPRVVNVGSGIGHSVRDVLDIIGRVTSLPLKVEWLPQRRFDVRAIVLDVTQLRRLIDWRPTPLQEGVERVWRAWQSWARPIDDEQLV